MRYSIKFNTENKTWMVMTNLGIGQIIGLYSAKADAYNYVSQLQENKLDKNSFGNYSSQLKKIIPKTLISLYGRHVAN